MTLIVPAAVLFENIIFIVSFAAFNADSFHYSDVYTITAKQIIWAMITGPALLIFLNFLFRIWDRRFSSQISEQKGYGL
jgi:hypothetical protein